MRNLILLLLISLLTASVLLAVPTPWVVSNIGPDGSGTRLYTFDGSLLEGEVLVEYYVDRDGDGIDPVLDAGRNAHPNTGDDSVLVAATFDLPETGMLPRGSFAFFFTIDTESAAQLEMNTFVRVYDSNEISSQSRFTTTSLFSPSDGVLLGQTTVDIPTGMYGYLGNQPPVVSLLPLVADPVAGETFHAEFQVEDDESPVLYEALLGEGEGEMAFSLLDGNILAGSWDVPVGLEGEFFLPVVISDGQFFDTTMVELTILPAGDRPSSFDLVSPSKGAPAFSGAALSWGSSVHPNGNAIEYQLQWSTGTTFVGGQWINGISHPYLEVEFTEGAPSPSGQELGRPVRSDGTGVSKRENTVVERRLHDESGVDETAIPLPLAEGTAFIWRVRALADDGSYRWCSDIFNAFAEFADPPTASALLLPESGAELEDANPAFLWQACTDPDLGDQLRYDLLISTDDGVSFDTIHAGLDTTWQMEEADLVSLVINASTRQVHPTETGTLGRPGTGGTRPTEDGSEVAETGGTRPVKRGTPSVRTIPEETATDDLPQDVTLLWKVDAVDLAGLRTSSAERTLSVVIPDRPTHFDLASPAPGTVFRGGDPVHLSWTPSVDADPDQDIRYSILGSQITPDDPEPIPTYFAEELDVPEWILELPNDQRAEWRWQVMAISGEDTVLSSGGQWHFFVRPVYTPVLVGPIADEVIEEEDITFRWAYPAGWQEDVTQSRLVVFDHPSMVDPVLETESSDTFHVSTIEELPTSEYWWAVTALEADGIEWTVGDPGHFIVPVNALSEEEIVLPTEFGITNAYPNPFNAAVTVVVAIPKQADVQLSVYDLLGREVLSRNVGNLQPGYRPLYLDFTGYATGTYLVRLHARGLVDTVQRIVLVK